MGFFDKVRGLGQDVTQGGQDFLKENVDNPLDEQRRQEAQQQIQAMAAMKAAGELNARPNDLGAQRTEFPGMANGLNSSQADGLVAMQKLKERDHALKLQLEQEAAQQAQSEADFNPAAYKKVPNKFEGLMKQMGQQSPSIAAPAGHTMQLGDPSQAKLQQPVLPPPPPKDEGGGPLGGMMGGKKGGEAKPGGPIEMPEDEDAMKKLLGGLSLQGM